MNKIVLLLAVKWPALLRHAARLLAGESHYINGPDTVTYFGAVFFREDKDKEEKKREGGT